MTMTEDLQYKMRVIGQVRYALQGLSIVAEHTTKRCHDMTFLSAFGLGLLDDNPRLGLEQLKLAEQHLDAMISELKQKKSFIESKRDAFKTLG